MMLRELICSSPFVVIKGSSLFFTFARDHFDDYKLFANRIRIVDVHWIDYCHMEVVENPPERGDRGFIKGLDTVLEIL